MKIEVKVRSDQWNSDDFLGGPRTFTIAGARKGTAEGPYDIDLVEGEGRCWRPPNSVISALILAWGTDEASEWVGRRVTLYRDPTVRFGNDTPGGIRVSHASHLDVPATVRVTTSRGHKSPVTIRPLAEPATPTDPTPSQIADATTPDELMALWNTSTKSATVKAKIAARKAELDGALHGEQGALA